MTVLLRDFSISIHMWSFFPTLINYQLLLLSQQEMKHSCCHTALLLIQALSSTVQNHSYITARKRFAHDI